MDEKEYLIRLLLGIADMVLHHHGECTQEHVVVSQDNGLIIFEIDVDGYYPSPTWRYIRFTDILDGQLGRYDYPDLARGAKHGPELVSHP